MARTSSEPFAGRPPSRRVLILIFDDAEVLDVFGPYEVFAAAGRGAAGEPPPFEVQLVAEQPGPVTLRHGLSVNPHFTLRDAPAADILVVPGGQGTRREMHNPQLTDWIAKRAAAAELVASVCTGALLLGRAGLLDGLLATTHHGAISLLRETAPRAHVVERVRFVDNGRVVLSAGISAGLDMSLHLVERLVGSSVAESTAAYLEYHWDRNEEGIADQGL